MNQHNALCRPRTWTAGRFFYQYPLKVLWEITYSEPKKHQRLHFLVSHRSVAPSAGNRKFLDTSSDALCLVYQLRLIVVIDQCIIEQREHPLGPMT